MKNLDLGSDVFGWPIELIENYQIAISCLLKDVDPISIQDFNYL